MDSNQHEIRILVACKRTMGCELYSQALNRHAGFRVAAGATCGDDVLRSVEKAEISVALISTALEDGPVSGLSVLQKLQEFYPGVKTILLFDRDESHLVIPAFRAGARGVFCSGQDDFKTLCRCVERVYAGQVWANSAQLTLLLEAFSRQPVTRLVDAGGLRLLTKREEDVVRLVQEGLTNREIGRELHLSEHTIRNNLFRIFDKLGVSTRVELALYAINNSKRVLALALNDHDSETNQGKQRLLAPVQ
jgi:DNA-binding NarL/FixJ family response regulator